MISVGDKIGDATTVSDPFPFCHFLLPFLVIPSSLPPRDVIYG